MFFTHCSVDMAISYMTNDWPPHMSCQEMLIGLWAIFENNISYQYLVYAYKFLDLLWLIHPY